MTEIAEVGLKAFVEFGDPRLPDRFWSKVKIADSGCWEWQAHLSKGYGHYSVNGKPRGAHRICYESLVAPIPRELVCDHLCRNKACVNPAHIEPVTFDVNVQRGNTPSSTRARWAKITHCPAGHEYSVANTYRDKLGRRYCRTCSNLRHYAAIKRRREEAASAKGSPQ